LRWLEYSALKTPTVASNIAEANRTIEDGKTGLLVPNTTEAWVEALGKLIEDKKLRIKMGENAYKEVKKNFNMETISKDYAAHVRRRIKLWRLKR
jgi:glycosyltransferase involved in cell wall biosynthesis